MTQNLYLGSSLAPALTATSPTAFVAAVAQIYTTVQYTNFPARAEAIADEIDANHPDLVGLQEVTNWTTTGANSPPGYDFLAILQAALDARGLHYRWQPFPTTPRSDRYPWRCQAAYSPDRRSPAPCS